MNLYQLLFVFVAVFACISVYAGPLEDYVQRADPNYSYRLHSSFRGPKYTVFVVNMTSQRYTVPGGVTPELWRHYLTICVPDDLDRRRAEIVHLHVNDGFNGDAPPTSLAGDSLAIVERMCSTTGLVSVQLGQIPNQPLVFRNDPAQVERIEDQILAYGWAQFLNHTDQPIWITRLAMVKATVRAMDTLQDLSRVGGMGRNCPLVRSFIVSGASKRGWVTWLTPAVDDRVVAIVPMMMPIQNFVGGNMGGSINAGYRALGYWTFALNDYVENGITPRLNTPIFKKLTAIEDPINYNNKLRLPKLVITATQDEFFIPDSPRFFWDQLIGEKHLFAVPDANHPVDEGLSYIPEQFYKLANATAAFLIQVTADIARPRYAWNLEYSNTTASIEFRALGNRVPSSVKLWRANTESATQRDFRLFNEQSLVTGQPANVPWISSPLAATKNKYWIARVSKPAQGWTGFLIEATYDIPGTNQKYIVTSNVNVVPDRYPFRPCYETNTC